MIESLTVTQGLKIALYGFTTVFIMLAILMLIINVLSKLVEMMTPKKVGFRKKDGYKRSLQLSAEYGLYRQDYCGCVFSKQARGI